ncbi:energy transducer TonB family protein [Dyella japonica]|nr:energy transducer TonB [Dyella japonica]
MNVLSRAMAVCICLCLGSTPLLATDKQPVSEASMLVKGSIVIGADGKVVSYTVDRPERIPPAVLDVVKTNVPNWVFEFDDRLVDPVKETMSIRVVARAVDETHARLIVAGASFADDSGESTRSIHRKAATPIRYPRVSFDDRVSGTVYVLLQIGQDGRVQQAFAEQVDLRQYSAQTRNEVYEHDLAKAAVEGTRNWTFEPPTTGPSAKANSWLVRVPVNFTLHEVGTPDPDTYGKWDEYMPGAVQKAPWAGSRRLASDRPDSLAPGMLEQLGAGPHLATALDSH